MLPRPGGAVFVLSASAIRGCTASGQLDTTIGTAPDFAYTTNGIVEFARTADGGMAHLGSTGWRRINAGFVPDTSLGAFGTVAFTLPTVANLIAQPDGGVLVGGTDGPDFKVLRYTSNGILDPGFGTNGTATFNVAGTQPSALAKLVAQPDGRILAIGKHYDTLDGAMVRFWP